MSDNAADARRRPLPRGPHRLSREEVERSQRDRLLAAAIEAIAEKGYAATSVGDILAGAWVSRATFYQLFSDKLDCFLAAYRLASELVAEVMALELAAVDPSAGVIERVDRVLGAYLQTLADNPVLARVFLVEVYAAGTAAIVQRRDSLDQFVDLLTEIYGDSEGLLGSAADQRFAAEALVGAISSMVTTMVGVGEGHRLPELHAPLVALAAELTEG